MELYYNGVAHFRDFGGQKIQIGRDLKCEDFYFIKFNKVSIYFSSELYLMNWLDFQFVCERNTIKG